MARGNNLPFPYGGTYFGGDSNLISASEAAHLEGATYEVNDVALGTARRLTLRVLRNKGSVRLKASFGVAFGATADWIGRKVRGYTASTGVLGMAVDDQLTTSVAQNDLFYAVERGPALCRIGTLTTGTTALTNGSVVTWAANGLITLSAAGRQDYGTSAEGSNITAGVTGNRRVLVNVGSIFGDKE